MKHFFLISAFMASLMVSALFAWHATRTHPEPTLRQPLAELLPTGEEWGWTFEDLPLGATESQDARAHDLLNLTDFVYRRYTYVGGTFQEETGDGRQETDDSDLVTPFPVPRSPLADNEEPSSFIPHPSSFVSPALRPGDTFEIYIAYWAPGKMPARMVNVHTPDMCWKNAGWVASNPVDDFQIKIDQVNCIPGRRRTFYQRGVEIDVVFWHLVEGALFSDFHHQSLRTKINKIILDPVRLGFNMRREQSIIRLSCDDDLSGVFADKFFREIIESLGVLGLYQ